MNNIKTMSRGNALAQNRRNPLQQLGLQYKCLSFKWLGSRPFGPSKDLAPQILINSII